MSTPKITGRQKVIREIKLMMGDGMIDVELDPESLDLCVDLALDRYRMVSANAMEESFLFLTLQPDVNVYTLPDEVQEVRDVYRQNMGATTGSGAGVDPFSLAYTNNMYLLASPTGLAGRQSGGSGMLATYELASQYQELLGRMFGRDVQFTWNAASKRILFHRRFAANETIALQVYNTKPEDMLFLDPYARPWLRDYTLARAKIMLSEAYGKFAGGLAGPQGGIQLKDMKQEAVAELERLEQEILTFRDSHYGMPFIIG